MWKIRSRKNKVGPASFIVGDQNGELFVISPFSGAGLTGLKAMRKAVAAQTLLEACKTAVPCLEDWIQMTGHGEVNRRDREALADIRYAIEEAEKDPLTTDDKERDSAETTNGRLIKALKMLRGQYVSFVRVTTGRDTEKDGNPYIAEVDAVIAEAERES